MKEPRAQVEEALRVLWTTTDAGLRAQADAWLTALQSSDECWNVSVALLASGASEESRLFGVTLLCNRLRGGGGGGLPHDNARSLRTELIVQQRELPASRLRSYTAAKSFV